MLKCDNCGKTYAGEDELTYVFPDIPGLLLRLEPGCMVPAGECPACEALVYPVAMIRVLVLLDGGLVQDVLTNQPGVEVAVLDQDTEGFGDDDIVIVNHDGVTLSGTLQMHETSGPDGLVDAAWRCYEH